MRDRGLKSDREGGDTLRKHNLQLAFSVLLSPHGSTILFCLDHPESSFFSCFFKGVNHIKAHSLRGQFHAMTRVRNPPSNSAKSSGFPAILEILNLRIPLKSAQFIDGFHCLFYPLPFLQFDVGAR